MILEAARKTTAPSGRGVVQFSRHLDHRPAEPKACEEPLRPLILLGGRQHHARHTPRPEELKRGIDKQPPDASTTMLRVNDDVVQDARWTTQRHIVVPLNGGVRVADHVSVVICDEDGLVGFFELSADEGGIALRRPWPHGQEALRVEVVMLLDEERAQMADHGQVGGCRAPDDWPSLGSELSAFAQQRLRSILPRTYQLRNIARLRWIIQKLAHRFFHLERITKPAIETQRHREYK